MNNKILISSIVFLLISCNNADNNNDKKNKPQTTPSYTSKKKNIDIKTIISDNNSIVSMAINNNTIYTKAYKGNINIWDMDGKKIAEIKDSNFTHSLTVGDKYIYAASSLDSSIKLWDKNNYTLDKILPTDNNITLMYDVKTDDKYFYSIYCSNAYKNGIKYISCDHYGLIIINKYTGNTVKQVLGIIGGQYSIDDRFIYTYGGGIDDILIFDKNTINIYDKINAKDYYDGQDPYFFLLFMKVIGNEIYINVKNRLLVLNKNNKEIIYSIKQDDKVKNILADDNYIYIFIDDNIINAFDKKNKKMINNIFQYNDAYDLSSNFFLIEEYLYFFTSHKVQKIDISNDKFSQNDCTSEFLIKEIDIDRYRLSYDYNGETLSKNNKYFAYENKLGYLNLIDTYSGKHIIDTSDKVYFKHPMSFSDDSKYIAYGHIGNIHVMNIHDFSIRKIKYNNIDNVKFYAFSENSENIIVYEESNNNGTLNIINIDTMLLKKSIKMPIKNISTNPIFSPDKKHIILFNNGINLVNIYTNKTIQLEGSTDKSLIYHSSTSFSKDGQYIAVAYSKYKNNIVKIYNTKGEVVKQLESDPRNIIRTFFSPNGKYLLLVNSHHKTITILDTRSYEIIKTIYAHKKYVLYAYFGEDNKKIFSFGVDSKLKVWDIGILSSSCIEKKESSSDYFTDELPKPQNTSLVPKFGSEYNN